MSRIGNRIIELPEGVTLTIDAENLIKVNGPKGELIGEKALSLGIKEIKFDRSGYKYHGKVRALADAVRKKGIKF